jgi:hypothetical protein
MSDYIPVDILNVFLALLTVLVGDDEDPIPYHDSILTGALCQENLNRFHDVCRMDKRTFLKNRLSLDDSRRKKR